MKYEKTIQDESETESETDSQVGSEDNEDIGITHCTDRHKKLPEFDDEIAMMMLANCNCDTIRCSCTSYLNMTEEEQPSKDEKDEEHNNMQHSKEGNMYKE